jgi:hypothetical protein
MKPKSALSHIIHSIIDANNSSSTALVKTIGGAMVESVAASAAVRHLENQSFKGLEVCIETPSKQ